MFKWQENPLVRAVAPRLLAVILAVAATGLVAVQLLPPGVAVCLQEAAGLSGLKSSRPPLSLSLDPTSQALR